MTNFLLLATGFLLGGIAFGIFALLLLVHRKPPSITMHARKPVDVPHTRRQWRDAPGTEYVDVTPAVRWEARVTDDGRGVRYEFMGVGNEEV